MEAIDWSRFVGTLPRAGVVYPKGHDKADLIERIRKAFAKFGVAGSLG